MIMTESLLFMKIKKYLYIFLLLTIIFQAYLYAPYLEKIIIDNIHSMKINYAQNPLIFISGYFIIYILFTALSIPVALVMGLLSGFIFETHIAIIIVSFASSIGATIAMLISRYLIYDLVTKMYSTQVEKIKENLDRYNSYYLFALRMSPIFPFFIINFCFGLTNIKVKSFYIISQLGMLPATILIILVGKTLNNNLLSEKIISLELAIYLSILGLLPFLFKKYVKKDLKNRQ